MWQNKDLLNNSQPFADFDAFLMTLKAKKRKTIRAERRKVAEQKISCQRKCGADITDADWKAFYHCVCDYVSCGARSTSLPMKKFFYGVTQSMPEHLMLVHKH